MSEGDTIRRVAMAMGQALRHDRIVAARGRPGGARLELLVASHVLEVTARGKHLLVGFDNDLTLHTHLGMTGSWHRYRPDERWRRPADAAVAVLETERLVAVCFGAPTVALIETRALPLHPVLSQLGPDLLEPDVDLEQAARRLSTGRASVAEALLDQHLVTGVGNVYRSEVLAFRQVDPFRPAAGMEQSELEALLRVAAAMLRANIRRSVRSTVPYAPAGERWVYGRAGRPCRRCGTIIRSGPIGRPPRTLYWCPRCQAGSPQGEA